MGRTLGWRRADPGETRTAMMRTSPSSSSASQAKPEAERASHANSRCRGPRRRERRGQGSSRAARSALSERQARARAAQSRTNAWRARNAWASACTASAPGNSARPKIAARRTLLSGSATASARAGTPSGRSSGAGHAQLPHGWWIAYQRHCQAGISGGPSAAAGDGVQRLGRQAVENILDPAVAGFHLPTVIPDPPACERGRSEKGK